MLYYNHIFFLKFLCLLSLLSLCGTPSYYGQTWLLNHPDVTLEEKKTEALSHYAWGYYLFLDEKIPLDNVVQEYLHTITYDPDSLFVINELLNIWAELGEKEKADKVIQYLEKLTEKHRHVVNLNIVVINAYIYHRQFKKAKKILNTLFRHHQWRNPFVIRKFVEYYKQTGDIRKADKLLQKVLDEQQWKGNFILEKTAALFYHYVANTDDIRIPKRKKNVYQRQAYEHSLQAVDTFSLQDEEKSYQKTKYLLAVLLHGNFVSKAIIILSALREKETNNYDTIRLLAECYETINNFKQALLLWKELSGHFPFDPFLHVRMGFTFKQLERYNDAILAYESAYQLNKDPRISFEIGALFLHTNQPEKALHYASLSPLYKPETYLLQAHAYQQINDIEKSLDALRKSQRIAKNIEHEELGPEYYLSLATIYYALNEKEILISTLKEALEQYSGHPELENFLGYYFAEENKNLQQAEQLVRNALEKHPQNIAYIDSMAWVFFRQKRYQKAVYCIDQVIADPVSQKDSVVLDHAGDIYFAVEALDKAIYFWEKALENRPKHPEKIREKISKIKQMNTQ